MIAMAFVLLPSVSGCKETRTSSRARSDGETRPPEPTPVASAPLPQRVKKSIRLGIQALCRFEDKDLRHDTAMVLTLVRKILFWPELEPCYARIKTQALKDHDHPLNVLIDSGYAKNVDLERIRRLPIPEAGQKRTNVNHIVFRAAHCPKVPFPDKAFAYLVGPMRDNGGFHSTHAMWALLMMRSQGCGQRAKVEKAVASLRDELTKALNASGEMKSTRGIDLNAERILFLVQSGVRVDALSGPVQKLLSAQRPDGAFAAPQEKRRRWLLHATTVSVWALSAVWAKLHRK